MFHLRKIIIVFLALSLTIDALPADNIKNTNSASGSVTGFNVGEISGEMSGNFNFGSGDQISGTQIKTGTNIGPNYVAKQDDHRVYNQGAETINSNINQGENHGAIANFSGK